MKPLNPKFCKWLEFQTFDDPELIKLAIACENWINAIKSVQPAHWLSIIGKSGNGKTHCARKLWKYAQAQFDWSGMNYFHKVIYWPAFVQELRSGVAFDARNEMKKWPVLCLDDIGAERDPSGFAAEELNALLGCRVGKWTLITSNSGIDKIAAIDERISSRLIRPPNVCVSVQTKDYGVR